MSSLRQGTALPPSGSCVCRSNPLSSVSVGRKRSVPYFCENTSCGSWAVEDQRRPYNPIWFARLVEMPKWRASSAASIHSATGGRTVMLCMSSNIFCTGPGNSIPSTAAHSLALARLKLMVCLFYHTGVIGQGLRSLYDTQDYLARR